MTPPLCARPVAALARAFLLGVLTLLAACSGSSGPKASPSTTTAPATTTTTTTAPTTTTVALPPNPQPTPDEASNLFINDWVNHDQAAAAQVATAAAVAAIFATPYTTQQVIPRGCSADFIPRKCSFGPPGGGSGALYEIELMPEGSNWYVSGASVES